MTTMMSTGRVRVMINMMIKIIIAWGTKLSSCDILLISEFLLKLQKKLWSRHKQCVRSNMFWPKTIQIYIYKVSLVWFWFSFIVFIVIPSNKSYLLMCNCLQKQIMHYFRNLCIFLGIYSSSENDGLRSFCHFASMNK